MNLAAFRNVPYQSRTHCEICKTPMKNAVIELPDFPMTEIYSKELVSEKLGLADQSFHLCNMCGHAQLANVIDIELQYGSTFSYHFRTSQSATGSESVDFFLAFVKKILPSRPLEMIVEVGCNDLYLLKGLTDRASRLIGIDPILKGCENEMSCGNVTAVGDFFENVELEDGIDVFICKDALEHVAHPFELVRRMVERAKDDTLFFFQFPLLETLLSGCRFDHVFHQHLNYFSLKSIIYMLNLLGCRLIEYTINVNHWGAVLLAFKKGSNNEAFMRQAWHVNERDVRDRYEVFTSNMNATAKRLEFLADEKVYGYGAALMLPVLSYHLKNDLSRLACIIDDDKRKEGLYYINLPVLISSREKITDIKDATVLVTAIAAMNNVRRILETLIKLNPKQIIVPLNTL